MSPWDNSLMGRTPFYRTLNEFKRVHVFGIELEHKPNRAFTRFTKLLIELTWTSFFRTLNKFEFVHLLVIKLEYPIFGFEQSNIVRPITSDVIEWLSWNLGKLSMHKYMKHCIVYKTWKLSISNAWINVKSKKAGFWWMGWSSAPQTRICGHQQWHQPWDSHPR